MRVFCFMNKKIDVILPVYSYFCQTQEIPKTSYPQYLRYYQWYLMKIF